MRSDFFVKLKYQSSSIILSVDIKYFVRDPLCDLNTPDPQYIAICAIYSIGYRK